MSEMTSWQWWRSLIQTHWLIVLAIVLAGFLRFIQLGNVPHGITWDEAAIGYNGYAIITTRRDEWLMKLPISFRSFGDYKAPLAIYVNGIFTSLFNLGLEPWAIRLPFALSGLVAVLGLGILTHELLIILGLKDTTKLTWLSGLAALWLTISPWHIHFTRTGFESGLAVTILIWSSWLTLKSLKSQQWFWWYLSVFGWAASFYTYHSSKITVPVLLLSLLIWQRRQLFAQSRKLILPVLIGAGLLLPLVKDALVGDGLARAGTLIFSEATSVTNFFQLLWKNLLTQDSLDFWIKGATTTLRHGDGQTGVIYWPDLLAIMAAIGGFGWRRWQKIKFDWQDQLALVGLVWTMAGLLPAILATETPHPNRAFLAVVGLGWLVLAGWTKLFDHFKAKISLNLIWFVLAAYVISIGHYQWRYYTHFKADSAEAFFDGYLEAAKLAVSFEKQPPNGKEVEKIMFTSHYGQPYIFVLLARKTNPIWYQGGALIKYEFASKLNVGDLARQNTLVIAGPTDDLPTDKADKLIYGSDGEVKFRVYYPHEL